MYMYPHTHTHTIPSGEWDAEPLELIHFHCE